ncbi:hypothetical protein POM88_028451 [Heracleum sosnowskyi]|uniref:Origin recognition complex subunit 2 n=1 Tax=Heracleum sosnowskyi TaxID=360622 RepID=A0AAD8MHM2_9APIA|nr:hypothetical protein POM88_028451 [Heracleum sosnowskyi]
MKFGTQTLRREGLTEYMNTPDIFIGLDTSISNPVLPFDDAEAYIFQDNLLACPPQESKSLDTISDINIVDEQELREVVSNIEPKHEKEIVSLIKSYKSLYSKWAFELRAGLGLLLYGFGSKKALIEDFASTTLTEYSVVVINGYLQSINLKQISNMYKRAEMWISDHRPVSSDFLIKVEVFEHHNGIPDSQFLISVHKVRAQK